MARENLYMVIDTETANGIFDESSNKLDLSNSLPYDVSFVICNKRGEIYKEFFFVVSEVFYDYNLM